MQDLQSTFVGLPERFWHAAVDPLHQLGWPTLALFLIIALLIALIATFLLRHSWVWSPPTFAGVKIKRNAHTYRDHLRISPDDYLAFHRLNVALNIEGEEAKKFIRRDSDRYYVVTIVEQGKRLPLVYKELRLQVPSRGGRVQKGVAQLDLDVLTDVRLNNGYEEDDENGTDIMGAYNVYVRRVRWYDVRHWLLHPNREIRLVIWVTLITTTVPVLLDLLFG